MAKKNKAKKIDRNQTVLKVNVGVFELRFSIAKVEVENETKTWKMVFASGTAPYETLADMARLKKDEAMEILCTGLYGTMSLCVNPGLLEEFMLLLKKERSNGKDTVEKNS